jgi:hypothetical protein
MRTGGFTPSMVIRCGASPRHAAVRGVSRGQPRPLLTHIAFERLRRRTNNPFAKALAQRRQIAADIAEIEPLLRQAAPHEYVRDLLRKRGEQLPALEHFYVVRSAVVEDKGV